MRNKIIIPIFVLIAIGFVSQVVYAVPATPSPTCEITATISSLEKTRTNIEGLGQPPRENFDYYKVNLDILSISTYKQEGGRSCDNSYIELAKQSGQKLSLTEYNKNPISTGQKIKAKIHFSGDEWFGGYFLSDIQILEGTTTPQDTKDIESSYWYYVIPVIIILLVIIFYILFRKRIQ